MLFWIILKINNWVWFAVNRFIILSGDLGKNFCDLRGAAFE